jgi:glycosyltransferase involved in cell wall biosynthesis
MLEYSVVIPVYNEEENLGELYTRLVKILEEIGKSFEIVFIDDGSEDSSFVTLKELASRDKRVKVIKFTRNFGQHPAIMAGFRFCQGKAIILMDADLQNPPEEIPKLIKEYKKGYDIVYGVREKRKDPFWRKIGSEIVLYLIRKMLNFHIPDVVSAFRIMDRKVIEGLKNMKEKQYYIATLIAWMGFSYTTVPVTHSPREKGKTGYNLFKLIFLTLDMIVGFSYAPLRWATMIGGGFAFGSIVAALYILWQKLVMKIGVPGFASLFVGITFLSGVQMILLGIIGEYIARIYREAQKRPDYVIDEII